VPRLSARLSLRAGLPIATKTAGEPSTRYCFHLLVLTGTAPFLFAK
jgi:hypothetical protein